MKVLIPQSWEDVSIKQFIALHKLKFEEQEALDYMVNVVSIICDLKYSEVNKISIVDLRGIFSKLNFINELPDSRQITSLYECEGVGYECCHDISKITAGQYIDLKGFIKEDAILNLHNVMAVLYIPKKKKYNEVSVMDIADKFFEKMPVTVAYPLAVFFCNLLKHSMPDINRCLEKKAMDQVRMTLKAMKK